MENLRCLKNFLFDKVWTPVETHKIHLPFSCKHWAIPFFIHTGVWTTKFLKPICPGKNDCLTHKSPGIEAYTFDPSEKNNTLENHITDMKDLLLFADPWKFFRKM